MFVRKKPSHSLTLENFTTSLIVVSLMKSENMGSIFNVLLANGLLRVNDDECLHEERNLVVIEIVILSKCSMKYCWRFVAIIL